MTESCWVKSDREAVGGGASWAVKTIEPRARAVMWQAAARVLVCG
jgi:hypothetical protein